MADLIGIFNANSKKTVFKFSGLSWFFLFEDLYNGEGSLQAKKNQRKTLQFKLKTVRKYKYFKATANFLNFVSFKKIKRKAAVNQ